MKIDQPLTEKFNSDKAFISVEFFPPKTEEATLQFQKTAEKYAALDPSFVTITYGAGGSTRDKTLEHAVFLKDDLHLQVMPHLTCVGHGKSEIEGIVEGFKVRGFRNIMSLRGDPPKNTKTFEAHPEGFRYANELVQFLKNKFPEFCLGVGGYPEKHPEAETMENDILNLKRKIDAGGDFITTQLFFDNQDFFDWVQLCQKSGIHAPVLPGLMPVSSKDQLLRIVGFCGARIPEKLLAGLEEASSEPQQAEFGYQWAFQQAVDLLSNGAPGIHLYALNKTEAGLRLIKDLRHRDLIS